MTFDDELQRAFAAMADRLRDDITREIATTAAVVSASAPRPAMPSRTDPAASLLQHIQAIDQAGSLTTTLDALVAALSSCAARAAIFLPHASRFRAWRTAGFTLDADHASPLDVAGAEAGLVRAAFVRGEALVLQPGGEPPPAFAGSPACAIAVPLTLGTDTVAVVYADAGSPESTVAFDAAAAEILCRHAARKVEALTAFIAAQTVVQISSGERGASFASRSPERAAPQGILERAAPQESPERAAPQGSAERAAPQASAEKAASQGSAERAAPRPSAAAQRGPERVAISR